MTLQDEFGIVTEHRMRRALYGNRMSHGKATHQYGLPLAAIFNPFDRPPAPKAAKVLPAVVIPEGLTVAVVLAVAASVTGVSVAEMKGDRLRAAISIPRQFAYWLIQQRLYLTTGAIGRAMHKDRTSAIHGIRMTNERLAADWPAVIDWRNRAAEMLGRLDARARSQPEHTDVAA